MTNEQINMEIAKLCGVEAQPKDIFGFQGFSHIPDYCNDLNAMHEAEKMLTDEQCVFIRVHLRERLETHAASRYTWHATARQRAEAFLRTLGKWEEAK